MLQTTESKTQLKIQRLNKKTFGKTTERKKSVEQKQPHWKLTHRKNQILNVRLNFFIFNLFHCVQKQTHWPKGKRRANEGPKGAALHKQAQLIRDIFAWSASSHPNISSHMKHINLLSEPRVYRLGSSLVHMEGAVLAAFGQSETRTGLSVFYRGNYAFRNRWTQIETGDMIQQHFTFLRESCWIMRRLSAQGYNYWNLSHLIS